MKRHARKVVAGVLSLGGHAVLAATGTPSPGLCATGFSEIVSASMCLPVPAGTSIRFLNALPSARWWSVFRPEHDVAPVGPVDPFPGEEIETQGADLAVHMAAGLTNQHVFVCVESRGRAPAGVVGVAFRDPIEFLDATPFITPGRDCWSSNLWRQILAFPELKYLELFHGRMSGATGMPALPSSLVHLGVPCDFADGDFEWLQTCTNLTHLNLSHTAIGGARMPLRKLESLATLDLSWTAVQPDALASLAANRALRCLLLCGCEIRRPHVEALSKLPALKALRLDYGSISQEDLDWLIRAVPSLECVTVQGSPRLGVGRERMPSGCRVIDDTPGPYGQFLLRNEVARALGGCQESMLRVVEMCLSAGDHANAGTWLEFAARDPVCTNSWRYATCKRAMQRGFAGSVMPTSTQAKAIALGLRDFASGPAGASDGAFPASLPRFQYSVIRSLSDEATIHEHQGGQQAARGRQRGDRERGQRISAQQGIGR